MSIGKIKVDIGPGMFSTEKTVSFSDEGTKYTLMVDPEDVVDDRHLKVVVLARHNGHALVDLPRETFTTGNRISISSNLLEE